ncbi:KAP family NTPase [uncultured Imperialibacter sp.]|uniref:KAP family P-loop NTPase fold protein n=1 Tax=uncultured Imperialibacter sp. TaxID=1672639 RepID=UPI0030DD2050
MLSGDFPQLHGERNMDLNFSSDKPVSVQAEDRFQRYDFSKRIAESIIQRKNSDGIVIGIYGAWGEGKTSVLNFINQELSIQESILIIKLNPWRYGDEETLLKKFFNKIATTLGRELDNRKEKLGSFISKYGSIGGIFGVDASGIGKSISDVDLEELKNRIDEFLRESQCKLVIFVDDIDRLDKSEIFTLFKLVKLTADFSNTTYLLSFDEQMVASAIGSRFGEGSQKSGENFLEKIIQVPLKVPQAQPDALKKYCFELVDKAINESGLELTKNEVRRFVSEFTENVLLKLKTPRFAVRYGNTLSFSIPLLKGEVNHVDLMLIEALKIFYPAHYSFVKENPHYFLSSYGGHMGYGDSREYKERATVLQENLDELAKDFSKREKEAALNLLSELFPRLNEAFNKNFLHDGANEWFKEKRIVSTNYFKRYFSYTVIKGELSDVQFDSFFNLINESSIADLKEHIERLIQGSSVDNFLHKIRSHEEDLPWDISTKLSLSLAYMGDKFPEGDSLFSFGMDGALAQATIFIYQVIKKHGNKDECLELAKSLMLNPVPFKFSYEVNNWLRTGETEEEKIFSTEQYIQLAKILRQRAIKDSKSKPLFVTFPDHTNYLLGTWKEDNSEELQTYLKSILDKDAKKIKELLWSFTPTARSSNHPEPYKSTFTKEQYEYLISLLDKEYIYERLESSFGGEIAKEKVRFDDRYEHNQTDINILRQFVHWYSKDNTREEK